MKNRYFAVSAIVLLTGLLVAVLIKPCLSGQKDEVSIMNTKTITQEAIFAAGCFWGVQEYFSRVPGVVKTEAGYTGGDVESPTYQEVSSGETGHAEAVRVVFDPKTISYEKLLGHFWEMHDPTSLNRQGFDMGTEYRSAIFYTTPEQEKAAKSSLAELEKSGRYSQKIVTEILPADEFYPAEGYHQDFLKKHPGIYCHVDLRKATAPK